MKDFEHKWEQQWPHFWRMTKERGFKQSAGFVRNLLEKAIAYGEKRAKKKVALYIRSRIIPLRDEKDHLPNAHKHLRGKNEAFDDILYFLEK